MSHEALLTPLKLRALTLRNRIMSTGHAPGLADDNMPKGAYQAYHAEKAKGGIGLTIFGGSSAVSADSALSFGQIDMGHDRVVPYLEEISTTVHAHGAAIMCQITHMGRRGAWRNQHWLPLVAPSVSREIQHRSFAKEMEDFDFRRILTDFAAAAQRAKDGGLDGVEVMAAAHHLIDQFLSPLTNHRSDSYGGSLENRARFGLEVLGAIRDRVGYDFTVGLRLSGDELAHGGLTAAECVEVTRIFADSGLIDFISVAQSTADTMQALSTMFPDMTYPTAPFLYLASAVKAQVDIPIFHASGIRDLATAGRAISEGHVDMVAMTRAHIADPHIVKKLMENRVDDIRQCVGTNYCVDFTGQGGLCIQNPATGRELTQPQIITRGERSLKVVVAGGGVAGLEAARAAAARGHQVVLFEEKNEFGGQINIAKRVPKRENIAGIVRWLEQQVRASNTDIRMGQRATAEAVLGEDPSLVFVATGGIPLRPKFQGAEFCTTSWQIISGEVAPGSTVLVYDEIGLQAGSGCVDVLTKHGAEVEMVTADRMVSEDVGWISQPNFLRNFYKNNVVMTPNQVLIGAYREGNGLIAVLRNEYTGVEEEREVDQIVCELGTLPDIDLYQQLRPASRNLGEIDYSALIDGTPQNVVHNAGGRFSLFRVGDALFNRNIHAAIYDSARLLKNL